MTALEKIAIACSTGFVVLFAAPGFAQENDCRSRVRDKRIEEELDEAEQLVAECLGEDPDAVALKIEHARILMARGRSSRAIQEIRSLRDEYPDHVGLRILEIQLLKRMGETGAAIRAIEEYPEGLERPPIVDRLAGILYIWREDWERGREHLDAYLERHPDEVLALYYRGIARQHLGASDGAEADYRRACDLAPGKTKACAALREMESGSATEMFGWVRPGYSQVIDERDGWSVESRVGVHLDRASTLQGGVEWRDRAFGGERLQDVRVKFQGSTGFGDEWRVLGGGAFGLGRDFIPAWDGFAELAYLSGGGIRSGLRLWRIQFPQSGVSVVVPKGVWYANPFVVQGRYSLTISDSGELSMAALARLHYYFAYPSSVSVAFGGGNRSDYLELRTGEAESHYVGLAGVNVALSQRAELGLDVVHRRERAGGEQYIQTQFLLKFQYTIPIDDER